jgi:hypothetical protein
MGDRSDKKWKINKDLKVNGRDFFECTVPTFEWNPQKNQSKESRQPYRD